MFNKLEIVGIFGSIAVMALGLSYVRFGTDALTPEFFETTGQEAAVVSSGDRLNATTETLETTLKQAVTAKGEVVRLVVDDVVLGEGAEAQIGDTLSVDYIGTLKDGKKFDSSYDRGQPFTFTLGEGKVIKGWEQGIVGMKEGGERVLVIPGELAYGNKAVGPIPPNATLLFTVKLLEVKK